MATKEKLLQILRKAPRTISELARELNLARNAITVHLDRLILDGLVIKGEVRRRDGAGKPAQEYLVMPGTEDTGSKAYTPFVQSILETLPQHLDSVARKTFLQTVGTHMAAHAPIDTSVSFAERLHQALAIVNELGATAELVESDDEIIVYNMACPLASAVRTEPCVCDSVAAFFEEATGAKTRADCQRGDQLICRYVIKK